MTNEDVLKEIGIGDCDTVVVATGSSLEASILAVMHCTAKLGVREIIAKAKSRTTAEILTKMGAQRVVNPEKQDSSCEEHSSYKWLVIALDIFHLLILSTNHGLATTQRFRHVKIMI